MFVPGARAAGRCFLRRAGVLLPLTVPGKKQLYQRQDGKAERSPHRRIEDRQMYRVHQPCPLAKQPVQCIQYH